MLHLTPFEPKDLAELTTLGEEYPEENVQALAQQKYAYTIVNGQGVIIACAGVIEWWPGRGEGWMVLNEDHTQGELVGLARIMRRFFKDCPFKRIEAVVAADFHPAQNWVRFLGFESEGRLRRYTIEGDDAIMFSKIRGDF